MVIKSRQYLSQYLSHWRNPCQPQYLGLPGKDQDGVGMTPWLNHPSPVFWNCLLPFIATLHIKHKEFFETRDYGGITGRAAVCHNSDGKKSLRNHQPTCTVWSSQRYLVVTCSKWSFVLFRWRLLLSIKLCSTYFFLKVGVIGYQKLG